MGYNAHFPSSQTSFVFSFFSFFPLSFKFFKIRFKFNLTKSKQILRTDSSFFFPTTANQFVNWIAAVLAYIGKFYSCQYFLLNFAVQGVVVGAELRHFRGRQVHRDRIRRQEGHRIRSDLLSLFLKKKETCLSSFNNVKITNFVNVYSVLSQGRRGAESCRKWEKLSLAALGRPCDW